MERRSTEIPLAATDPAPVAHLEASPGLVLAGKYQLVREIGRGGMGGVWLAERRGWGGAQVAVKLMTIPDTPIARERFEREVSLAATLRSPHVVQVLDHGVDETTAALFIVMELLEGESLGSRLRRLSVLSPREVMMLVTHLCRALTRAHAAGIVHRDLKPDNVFLVANGDEPFVKVLDFGLAKAFDMTIDSRAVTAQGNAVGTPWYMSPEQIRGATPDHCGDLWSLAVIACECLTGQRPFQASDLPTMTLLLWSEQRPVPSRLGVVPPGFDAWFAKATHRDVEQRFQSAQELVDALRDVCGSSRMDMPMPPLHYEAVWHPRASSLDPVTRPSEERPFLSRRRKLVFGVIAGLVVGLGGNAYFFLPRLRSTAPPTNVTASQALTPTPTAGSPAPQALGQSSAAVVEAEPAAPIPQLAEAESAVTNTPPVATPPAVEPPAPARPVPYKKPRRPRVKTDAPPQLPPPDDRTSPTPNEDF